MTLHNQAPQTLIAVPAKLTRQIGLQASGNSTLQALFANGLLWCFGFHHEQAQYHFRQLLEQDCDNPLGLWGLAYASAPFYNRPWSWFSDDQKHSVARLGHSCIEKAQDRACAIQCSESRDACIGLISALSLLFRTSLPVSDETYIGYQGEYADRMLELAKQYPDQADITTLACEALLNCTPWQLWDINNRSQAPGSRVDEALALLQPLLSDNHPANAHPGVLHLHIHALEMSPFPERAADSAAKIRQLVLSVPSQDPTMATDSARTLFPPHLPHMASHIDVLQGNYRNTIDINRIAADADRQIAAEGGEFYLISRLHNVHMMLYAAMMAGREADAMDAKQRLESLASTLYCENSAPFLKVSVEGFFANRLHASVRFGNWQEIRQEHSSIGADNQLELMQSLPFVRAMQSYTLGVALANSAESHGAEKEFKHFRELAAAVPEWYSINNNPASDILTAAKLMFAGEHHYHLGRTEEGLDFLRQAVVAVDKLAYCEPWAWMHPPRHALGALLLEQGQVDEARQVYETDLGLNELLSRSQQNPKNIWALQGLQECFERLFPERKSNDIQGELQEAIAYADIAIKSSCFCRGAS